MRITLSRVLRCFLFAGALIVATSFASRPASAQAYYSSFGVGFPGAYAYPVCDPYLDPYSCYYGYPYVASIFPYFGYWGGYYRPYRYFGYPYRGYPYRGYYPNRYPGRYPGYGYRGPATSYRGGYGSGYRGGYSSAGSFAYRGGASMYRGGYSSGFRGGAGFHGGGAFRGGGGFRGGGHR